MKYTQLRTQMESKQSKMFKKLGVFFAFSNEQFKDGAKGEKKITKIGAGGFVPSKNAKKFIQETTDIVDWFTNEVKKLNPDDVIKYELDNHEAYYSGSIHDTYRVVKEYGYTAEQVREVYNKNINNFES